MNILNNDICIEKYILDALEKINAPLTTEQLKKYAMIMNENVTERNVNDVFNRMMKQGAIFVKGGFVQIPKASRKTSSKIKSITVQKRDPNINVAFSVFLNFAKLAGDMFHAAQAPAQIVFITDKLYRITVYSDDKNMRTLNEKRMRDDVVDIIVGFNHAFDDKEIKESCLPTKNFIFAEYRAETTFANNPEIRFERIEFDG